ncbi:MAG: DEAD/DEAH box helicase family protein, partial [Phycisphaerae bacterium]|nr:DEAD/DEAH box helicase family protein [Phycisphaerae bacterium]
MDRGGFNKKFLAKLMSHQQRVVILRGRARSGKTTAALELYRSYLDEAGSPRCLLIVPNRHTVADLKRRALAESPTGVVLSPQVMTFAALARRILSASGKPGVMLSPARR